MKPIVRASERVAVFYTEDELRNGSPKDSKPVVVHPDGGQQDLKEWATGGKSKARYVLLPHWDPEEAADILHTHHSLMKGKQANPQFTDDDIMNQAKAGGFTFHDHTGDGPASGYMVSPHKGTEDVTSMANLTPQHIRQYVNDHAHELSSPDSYLGGWLDKDKFYLDVSRHRPSIDRAAYDAAQNNQLAIYDLNKGKTIHTPDAVWQAGDPGLAVKQPKRNPFTSANHTPEEQQARMMAWLDSLPDHDYTTHHLGDAEHWGEPEAPPEVHQARLAALNPDGSFDLNGLSPTGQHPGSHAGNEVYKHPNGEQWLIKAAPPGSEFLTDLDVAGNQIAHQSGIETPATFKTTNAQGQSASAQTMYPGAKDAFPNKEINPDKMSEEDLLTIQKHHALDWMIGNHDSHAGQFIRNQEGKLIGIDKGQAFKYFNNDKLHWGFHPNGALYGEGEPVYNTFYRGMAQGGRMMNDPREGELGKYIQGLQSIPDDHYREMLRPYAEGAAKVGQLALDFSKNKKYNGWVAPAKFKPNDVEAFLDAAVARKNSLMHDMGDLHDRAMAHRMTGMKLAKYLLARRFEAEAPDPNFLQSLHKTLGTHKAKLFQDPAGTQWLVKQPPPGAEFMAPLDAATSALQDKAGLDNPETHLIPWQGGHASAVKMIPGAQQAFPHPPHLRDLSPEDLATLQKHQALDWLISNHDGHVGNFMRTPEGGLVGIDKGQAFKYFGRDKLSPDFHPNYYAREPIYNNLWREFSHGHPGEMQDPRAKHSPVGQFVQQLSEIPDDTLKNMFRPYAEQAAGAGLLVNPNDDGKGNVDPQRGLGEATVHANDPEEFLTALVKRKNNLANDLGSLYDRAFQARQTAPPVQPRGKHEIVPHDSPSWKPKPQQWKPAPHSPYSTPKPAPKNYTDPHDFSDEDDDDFWKIGLLEEMYGG